MELAMVTLLTKDFVEGMQREGLTMVDGFEVYDNPSMPTERVVFVVEYNGRQYEKKTNFSTLLELRYRPTPPEDMGARKFGREVARQIIVDNPPTQR